MTDFLSEAQMQAECLLEAWCELQELLRPLSTERREVVRSEIGVRVRAVIRLLEAQRTGTYPDAAQAVVREANAYNGGPDEELAADRMGAH